jgi:hypothetical protein
VSVGIGFDDTADTAVGDAPHGIEIVNEVFQTDACFQFGFSLF